MSFALLRIAQSSNLNNQKYIDVEHLIIGSREYQHQSNLFNHKFLLKLNTFHYREFRG
jgi:hypothetical protein